MRTKKTRETKDMTSAHGPRQGMRRLRTALVAIVGIAAAVLGLAGCSQQPSGPVKTESTIKLEKGAENTMLNGALKLTVLDVQRRPISVFQTTTGTDAKSDTRSDTSVSNTDIIIEVDIRYTYNQSTLSSNTQQAGGDAPDTPRSLGEALTHDGLMYIQGKDADGESYTSSTIMNTGTTASAGTLGINSQWDYNLSTSALPQTSEEKRGSILFRVASTAKDLNLVIVTPMKNADPLDAESITSGSHDTYIMDIS